MRNNKVITEVSRIQGIMGIKSIISEQSFWDDLLMLGLKAGKNVDKVDPSLIVKSAADEIVIGGIKVSDELSTLLKKEMKELADSSTTLKQSVDDVLQLAKTSDPDVYKKLVDSIYNSEKLYDSLSNLVTDADTAIKNLVKERGFSLQKAYDKVMEDVMKSVKNSNMVPDSLIPRISKEIAEQSKVSVKSTGLVAKLKGLLTKNLKTIKTKISFALGENTRTIIIAYKNIFKSFKKIEMEIFDIVDEMIEFTGKNPQYGVNAVEPYFKRIKDLAASAVRTKTVSMKKIIDKVIEDTPALKNNPTLQTEFRVWAQDNLGKYIMDEKIISSETFIGKAKRLSRPYMELLNYRKFFTAKGFGDICKRTFQVVLKGTPYTASEIAKRIGTSGVRNQLGRRAVSAALTTTIIIPTIAGIANSIVWFFGSFIYDGGGKKFFDKELDFEQSKGNMMEAALSAAKAVFPDSWLEVSIFTTYVPMVLNKTSQLLTAVPDEFYDDDVKLAAAAGMAILNGEDVNLEGLEDKREGVIKVESLKKIIKKIYPTIKDTTLKKIYWDSGNAKAYFKFYTTATEWTPKLIRLMNDNDNGNVDKIYIVQMKNGKEQRVEIDKL